MEFIKKIVKIGNSQGVLFTKEDMEDFGMVIGDQIDLSDLFLVEVKKKRKKNGNRN